MADKRPAVKQTPIGGLSYIGCKRDAIAAAKGSLPEIGRGAFRAAYVNGRGDIVYKIEHGGGWAGDSEGQNRDEYAALWHYKYEQGQTWASGAALYYVDADTDTVVWQSHTGSGDSPDPQDYGDDIVVVIAMRRYPTRGGNAPWQAQAKVEAIIDEWNLDDMHGGNWYATRAGRVRVTDLGFGQGGAW